MLEAMVLALALAPVPQDTAAQPPAAGRGPRTPARMSKDEAEDFLEEVQEYVELRRKARAELPALKEDAEPEEVTAYAKTLTANIAARRKGAKQGDVFKPKVAAAFRRICRDELARSSHERKVVLTEGNPTGDEERFGAPVETLDPFKQIAFDAKKLNADLAAAAQTAAVAVGLALRRAADR